MKIISNLDPVTCSATADGRYIEFIGLGLMVKNTRAKGRNVKTGAIVKAGERVSYTLKENEAGTSTTLTITYHRPGQIFDIVYTADMSLEQAAEYWELENYNAPYQVADLV